MKSKREISEVELGKVILLEEKRALWIVRTGNKILLDN